MPKTIDRTDFWASMVYVDNAVEYLRTLQVSLEEEERTAKNAFLIVNIDQALSRIEQHIPCIKDFIDKLP